MAIKAGVWIDHRQATVVLVTNTGKRIKKIASGIEKPDHSRLKHKYTRNDFVAEDRLEHKLMSRLKDFYNEVIASVRGAEQILIVGPGEVKAQFRKLLKSKEHRGRIAELETTDKMTDSELVAKMELHFADKSANPRGTANKAPKTTSGKRTKKLGRR
jgi:stalled ribosome rescue protein Dom34